MMHLFSTIRIAIGLLFPQDQAASGGYTRTRLSSLQPNFTKTMTREFDNWLLGAAATGFPR